MGQLSCVVMVAFVGMHVALVLCAVGLGSPGWLEGTLSLNHSSTANATEQPKATLGLWKYCVNDTCTSTAEGKWPGWYKSSRITEVVAVAAILVAMVFFYGFLLFKRCDDSVMVIGMAALCNLAGAGTAISSVALFGQHNQDASQTMIPKDYDTELGWTFYVSCVGAAVALMSAICVTHATCKVKSRQRPYENI